MNGTVKTGGIALLAFAAAGALAVLLVRGEMGRHRRELFSPYPLKRLASLGHMARSEASVYNINLLRDFVAWEPKRLLRNRARVILKRMEDEALAVSVENSTDDG